MIWGISVCFALLLLVGYVLLDVFGEMASNIISFYHADLPGSRFSPGKRDKKTPPGYKSG
jgi:hypothetical protein